MINLSPRDFVLFNLFEKTEDIEIDLVYANAHHPENLFGQIYHPSAGLWGHHDMVTLAILASRILATDHGWTLVIKDCLRPVEAQQKIAQSPIVQSHPEWMQEPRFLSSPGKGAHPRGMAIDVAAKDKNGCSINFGTTFDFFASNPLLADNPAHRDYPQQTMEVRKNREILNQAIKNAAEKIEREVIGLSTEWWDFRFKAEQTNQWSPVFDTHLEPWQKMVHQPTAVPAIIADKMMSQIFDRLQKLDNF